jgi:hypothetical protein
LGLVLLVVLVRAGTEPVRTPLEGTMSTTVKTTEITTSTFGAMIRSGVIATVAASVATMAVAAAGHAAGVSLEVAGAPIPVTGFGVLTAAFSLVGVVIAALMYRFARRPRRTFVRTTVVLTVLSLVPDVIADAGVATKVLLMLTHLVAAAIVIPAVARRLTA